LHQTLLCSLISHREKNESSSKTKEADDYIYPEDEDEEYITSIQQKEEQSWTHSAWVPLGTFSIN